MPEKLNSSGLLTTHQKCTPVFKAGFVRQVAAGSQALEQAVSSSTEREEIKHLRTKLKPMEMERGSKKSRDYRNALAALFQPPQS